MIAKIRVKMEVNMTVNNAVKTTVKMNKIYFKWNLKTEDDDIHGEDNFF